MRNDFLFHFRNNCDWLDTGDVILFRGRGWRAKLIELTGWCDYSHIGIVHRYGSVLYLLESTGHGDGLECVLDLVRPSGKAHPPGEHKHASDSGARLVLLQDRLRQYIDDSPRDELSVRICIIKSFVTCSRALINKRMEAFEDLICGAEYDSSAINFLRDSYVTSFAEVGTLTRMRSFTCTELVAAALVHIGICNGRLAIDEVQRPRYFLDGTINESHWGECGELSVRNEHLVVTNKRNV